MRRYVIGALVGIGAWGLLHPGCAGAVPPSPTPEIVIDVDEQQLKLIKAGQEVAKFPVSTSKYGVGDDFYSYKTPVGVFKVCEKTGGQLPLGAVLKRGQFTGEVLVPNAPGRDPIVTRMIRLKGVEPKNSHAFERGIFIHGTPEERNIGKPVSWGCIRMRSKDVAELFKHVQVGTRVVISGKGRALDWWSAQLAKWF